VEGCLLSGGRIADNTATRHVWLFHVSLQAARRCLHDFTVCQLSRGVSAVRWPGRPCMHVPLGDKPHRYRHRAGAPVQRGHAPARGRQPARDAARDQARGDARAAGAGVGAQRGRARERFNEALNVAYGAEGGRGERQGQALPRRQRQRVPRGAAARLQHQRPRLQQRLCTRAATPGSQCRGSADGLDACLSRFPRCGSACAWQGRVSLNGEQAWRGAATSLPPIIITIVNISCVHQHA